MNSLMRLKEAMKTESTIAAIAEKANVPRVMVKFHVGKQPPQKRLIVVKDK